MNSILISGGTGFFGQHFVRHLLAKTPVQRICVFSRSEHIQADMARKFKGDDLDRLRFFIGDVRDRDRLRRAMQGCDVVVHAAALKRIEVGQYNPSEMFYTNVMGATNVVEAARDAKVTKVVALSTDKAWRPVSPYGYSKAMAEAIFLAANDGHGPMFSVTRYGNVAASAGSVIPYWRALKYEGQSSVPVTDPDCTRFWMTISEAIALVLETIVLMHGGELEIPTLPSYRLGDLATAMDLEMNIIGLPGHEKRHEGMRDGQTSDAARRMTVGEIREALKHV